MNYPTAIAAFAFGLITSAHGAASANCGDQVQSMANRFLQPASQLAGTRIKVETVVTSEVPHGFDALADSRNNRIFMHPRVCSYGDLSKLMLIAHEIGHFVAHARLPILREDAYSGNAQIGASVHEGVADEYAAKIMKTVTMLDFAIDAMAGICAVEHGESVGLNARLGGSACAHLNSFASFGEERK